MTYSHWTGKPYMYKQKYFKGLVFGLNKIGTLTIYKKGFVITSCYFRTIMKKNEYCIGFFPFEIVKIKYPL